MFLSWFHLIKIRQQLFHKIQQPFTLCSEMSSSGSKNISWLILALSYFSFNFVRKSTYLLLFFFKFLKCKKKNQLNGPISYNIQIEISYISYSIFNIRFWKIDCLSVKYWIWKIFRNLARQAKTFISICKAILGNWQQNEISYIVL